ncbi:MAG: amino acid adenylation domain-containing protein, partial [Anaerolineae bacterium]|nr:amino acid adenylation domain-containing protein [Anaerolineae bacterium]
MGQASDRQSLLELLLEEEGLDIEIEPRIPACDRTKPIPLSYAQQRLWFLDKLTPNTPTYNIFGAVRLIGPLNIAAFEKSISEIFRRHDSLRTTFTAVSGRPYQVITPFQSYTLPFDDISAFPPEKRKAEAQRIFQEESQKTFDLSRDLLLKARLIRITEEDHHFLWNMHHIASDAWSFQIFQKELVMHYQAFIKEETSPLPDLTIQYADFAAWQQNTLDTDQLNTELAYWKEQLKGKLPLLELPADFQRPNIQTYRGGQVNHILSQAETRALNQLAQQQGTTLFMLLLATFTTMLYRISGQEDIIIGSPIAGRENTELEPIIGVFLNTLALRTDLSGAPSFNNLLKRIQKVCLDAYANQNIPYEKLLEEIQPERDLSRTPVFQVLFNMFNQNVEVVKLPGIEIEDLHNPQEDSKFDLTLYLYNRGEDIDLSLVYNADLFASESMEEFLAQYLSLLAQIIESPDKTINDYTLVTNHAQNVLPNPKMSLQSEWQEAIHELASQQAAQFPQNIAVMDAQDSWTYQELETRSNQLAHHLIQAGIQPQDVVPIYAHRSASLVWALLGVLKAGAAFVILDPDYPAQRLINYIELSQPRGFIQLEAAGPLPPELEAHLKEHNICCQITLPRLKNLAGNNLLTAYPITMPAIDLAGDDLAYIAFTSGSTGQPKGVLGPHKSLTHFFKWHIETFGFVSTDRFSLLSGLGHDPLLRDIFTPLCLGATLLIPVQEEMLQPGSLAQWFKAQDISVTHLTPAISQALTMHYQLNGEGVSLPSLRLAFFGGDVLAKHSVERLRAVAPQVTCVNFYGATETPQAMSYFIVPSFEATEKVKTPALERIPLGRGISDAQLLILNAKEEMAGIRELGEIHIRTPYLAKGYLRDAALTQERFIRNPITNLDNDMLYKTGDLGRYRYDGTVDIVGRKDRQIKIRGYRIEPREIEATLGHHPSVKKSIVVTHEADMDSQMLVAYLVLQDSESVVSAEEMREFCKGKLPRFMIPASFTILDKIPLTPNGKIDFRSLPEPAIEQSAESFTAPRTETEKMLVSLWEEVLNKKPISVYDNFFQLGGHSLLALELFAKLDQRTGKSMLLSTLFEAPTVTELAARIDDDSWESDWSVLVPIKATGYKAPFFYVAPYTISVIEFSDIASHFPEERPFYAIQPFGLAENETPHTSIEEIAAHNIEAMQSIQPQGPYYLGGHCSGAWIAYEMALQLEQQGKKVAYLAIVDSPAPNYNEADQRLFSYLTGRFLYYFRDRRLLPALAWKIKLQTQRRILFNNGSPQVERTRAVVTAHRNAFTNYELRDGYQGP